MSAKSEREAAIRRINDAADLALKDLEKQKSVAQQMIDDAKQVAVTALESSRPDARKINGSYQWEPYRRGSDDRLDRLESGKIISNGRTGKLEVGQAKREEQIIGVLSDCSELKVGIDDLKGQLVILQATLNTQEKEFTSRMSTQREFILSVKEDISKDIELLKNERIEAERKMLWKIIGAMGAIAFLFLLVTITLATGTLGQLP